MSLNHGHLLGRLAVIAVAFALPACASQPTVLSVGDGDTLAVATNGKRVTVRLACVDAPETTHSPYGRKSKESLQRLVPLYGNVKLDGEKKDRYGRTVAEVFRGGTNVNLEMVRLGHAFVYRQYLQGCDRDAYFKAERQAEAARSGIWSVAGGVTRPWEWRNNKTSQHGTFGKGDSSMRRRYRCSEIGSWSKAQEYLKQGHAYLDADRDGEACEGLR